MKTFPVMHSLAMSAAHHALHCIQARYGQGATPDNRLAFHNVQHTIGVMARTKLLMETMAKTEALPNIDHDTMLGCVAAAFHDVVQGWEEKTTDEGLVVRAWKTGANEKASAHEAVTWMLDHKVGEKHAFSFEDCLVVQHAILTTTAGLDSARGCIIQPQLKSDSTMVSRALALADLGAAGMEGADFAEEGDRFFREEHLGIQRAIDTNATDDQQLLFRQAMLDWTTGQIAFIWSRTEQLERDLEGLGKSAKERVRGLFTGFDAATAAVMQQINRRQNLSFWELAKDMGYTISPAHCPIA